MHKRLVICGIIIAVVLSCTSFADEGRLSIEKMREIIQKRGHKFLVSDNPILKFKLRQLCGLNPALARAGESSDQPVLQSTFTPSSYDLRSSCTPIRNQGGCGSCWSFATVAVIEYFYGIDLSEQFLINCNKDRYGCNGGWFAFHMFLPGYGWKCNPTFNSAGGATEAQVPYKETEATCVCPSSLSAPISNWKYVKSQNSLPSVDEIKTAIYSHGPVAAAINATFWLQAYSSGVFDRDSSGDVNHAIVLVGWDDSKQAWILRNSWDITWGINGYCYIAYNCCKVGFGACYPIY